MSLFGLVAGRGFWLGRFSLIAGSGGSSGSSGLRGGLFGLRFGLLVGLLLLWLFLLDLGAPVHVKAIGSAGLEEQCFEERLQLGLRDCGQHCNVPLLLVENVSVRA